MTLKDQVRIKKKKPQVVLLEGTRSVDAVQGKKLTKLAAALAENNPTTIFRSGNASGSDDYFAKGRARVDPSRLELILPFTNSGRNRLHKDATIMSMDDMTRDEVETIADLCLEASPDYKSLVNLYLEAGRNRLTVKAMYLLRDVVKVTGMRRLGFQPATSAMFNVNPENPAGGGTGHTIRVCEIRKIPFFTQSEWVKYICLNFA